MVHSNKFGISRFSKVMIVGQFVFIVGVFAFFMLLVPKLNYPINGAVIQQRDVGFDVENAKIIIIDDNMDFSSAVQINLSDLNSSKILFKPGTYYWKVIGVVGSEVREFTVASTAALELDEESSTLKNVGNSILNVSVGGATAAVGLVILDVNVEYPVETEDGIVYMGEQYG